MIKNIGDFWVIMNALLYCVAFIVYYWRSKSFNIGYLLLLWYIITAFCACYNYFNFSDISSSSYSHITFFPFVYLFITLMIFFQPILKFSNDKIVQIAPPNKIALYSLSSFIVIVSLIRGILFLPEFAGVISLIRSGQYFFKEIYSNSLEASVKSSLLNDINIISILSSQFSEIAMLLFFYLLTLSSKNKILIIGLGVSSLLPVFQHFISGYRSSQVSYILALIFLLFVFKKFISVKTYKYFKIILVAILFIVLFGFLLVSIDRFGKTGRFDNYVLYSFADYAGQSFLNFNEYVFNTKALQMGDNCFPVFRMLIGLDHSKSPLDRQNKWIFKTGIPAHLFYNFIGDFCLDYGPIVTFIFIIVISLLFVKLTMFSKYLPFHHIILLFFVYNICVQGVFYFMYKTIGGNLKIIAFFLVYILFRLTSKKNNFING